MSEFDKGKKRSCCCPCLVTRSSKIIVSVTIVLLVLLGIALSVFYLFPREPKIWIEKPDNEPTFKNVSFITGESNVLSGLLKASVASPFTLLAAFTLKLTAYSPNYIDVYANKIVFDVQLFFSLLLLVILIIRTYRLNCSMPTAQKSLQSQPSLF